MYTLVISHLCMRTSLDNSQLSFTDLQLNHLYFILKGLKCLSLQVETTINIVR